MGLWKLPGDIVIRGKHSTIYIPLTTCLVVSVVLTLVVNVVLRFLRK